MNERHGEQLLETLCHLVHEVRGIRVAIETSLAGSGQRLATKKDLDEMEGRTTELLNKIMLTQQQLDDLLNKIDATTTKVGANVDTIATIQQSESNDIQTISDEIDAFLKANPPGTTLTDAQATQLQALADRLQTSSDHSDAAVTALQAQAPVLKAIAAKGQPTTPPPPPPVTPAP